MSWNKYNVYNLQHPPLNSEMYSYDRVSRLSVYAQQQKAKRYTRKYHGHGITETVFKRKLTSPGFNAVAGGTPDGQRFLWGSFYRGIER
jgi:hypothetical protein